MDGDGTGRPGEGAAASGGGSGRGHDGTLRALAVILAAGAAGIVLYALQFWSWRTLSVASVGVLVAGGSLLSGGLLGFLFGIPRTSQGEAGGGAGAGSEAGEVIGYRVNTNLEQISDWLTKILVGVGLTQIGRLSPQVRDLADYLAPGLGGAPSSPVFAVGLLAYFVVCGFLVGYLWTRLFLAGALRLADLDALGARVARAEHQAARAEARSVEVAQAQKDQAEADILALTLVDRVLNATDGSPPVSQADLDGAVAGASAMTKVQIFLRAQEARSQNWRDEAAKPQMERTIPVFRALVGADPDGRFHRNHAQLAYALKDSREPALAEAEAELTRAIEIRGDWEEYGWLFYELNRAMCRIALDREYRAGAPSVPERAETILADLKAAAANPYTRSVLLKDPAVERWMTINGVASALLTAR